MNEHKLKIAIIADPEIPVPPLLYGGIERIIALLVDAYINLGHEVTLFAHRDSKTSATLIPYCGESSNRLPDILRNAILINRELFNSKYDLVHSFGRLLYLLPQLRRNVPILMSYQREPTLSQIKKAVFLSKKNTLSFTGCSAYISSKIEPYANSFPIFNGVELNKYQFQETVSNEAPLTFLGRIEPIKGTHTAIEIAQKTNKSLIIAGNIPTEYEDYFTKTIKPNLSEKIKYIGPANDQQKNELLGQSSAFLMPIHWDEPFGIVMAEALACGTPVVALRRGSVPEVVKNGLNGYYCDSVDDMVYAVNHINEINRKEVRKDAESRFSSTVIVEQYLKLYLHLISKTKTR